MLIQHEATKHKREVSEEIGRRLIASRIASSVIEPVYRTSAVEPEVEISPRTGKPKRQYKRRDMRAED